MKKKLLYLNFLFILLLLCQCKKMPQGSRKDIANVKNSDLVPDSETAKQIAEIIWIPIYGESVLSEKPYKTNLVGDSLWVVEGNISKESLGGAAYIEIRKRDCKILKVIHGK